MINRIYTAGPLATLEDQHSAILPQVEQAASPIGFNSSPTLPPRQPEQQAALELIKLDQVGETPLPLSPQVIPNPESAYKPKRPKVSPAPPPELQTATTPATGLQISLKLSAIPRSAIWGAGMGFVLFIGMMVTIQFYDLKQDQKLSSAKSLKAEKSKLMAAQNFIAPAIGQARVSKTLTLHERASEKSKLLGELSEGLEVEILKYASYFDVHDGENGKWVKVRYEEQEGWCWGGELE
jgi:hypothetical protein